MKNKIKVMLVEDHPDYRAGIALALETSDSIELTGEFVTAERALRSLQEFSNRKTPDVVLLDLNLPGMSGLEALPWFKKYVPEIEIIVLTQSNKESDVLTAVAAGASGYLLKSATLDHLEDGIQTVVDGGSILDARVARFLLKTMKKSPPPTLKEDVLTERELEILIQVSHGLSKKEIAEQLNISPKTVCIHVSHIYEKLNVPNAPAAVDRAHRLGLFSKSSKAPG